ncbi:cytochrome-c peroxidase [Moorena sp. SIOASIH]|uniref:cytochrome-c peroxidase n=1 Tax=Moorena sp. SIOASIH TaxID=2607817 RepID=UPI0025E671AC|nr:cytochrome-c peroxidase [Moorena sp. SIOASIH]
MVIVVSIIIIFINNHYKLSYNSIKYRVKYSEYSLVFDEPIQPIPLKLELNKDKVKLGKRLFHDPQLSQDNTISCASCHNLNTGGTDQMVRSIGINNRIGLINAPTVFNSGFNFKQHWDGSVETLIEQIDRPIHAEHEMGSNWQEILSKLKQSPEYVSLFSQLYKDGINSDNIKDAIATFERSLYTPNSRFDQFLHGHKNALSSSEQEGYRLFKAYGCVSCHQGVNVGSNMFQAFGLFGDYFKDRGKLTKADLGRFNVTGNERDRYVFKVPSLRNVALTSPYFHDGSAETLEEAVTIMGKYELGRPLSPNDIGLIVKFLKTLTGEYQGKPL